MVSAQQEFSKLFLLIESFLESFFAERGAANNSLIAYKKDLLDFAEYSNGKIDLYSMRGFLEHLKKSDIAPRSIARKLSALRQFCSFLVTEGEIEKNYALMTDAPKFSTKLPNILSASEIKNIIDYAAQDLSTDGLRTITMISLLYASGMRVSELVSLRMSHLDYRDSIVSNCFNICGKGMRERLVVINEQTCRFLENYLKTKPHSEFVFPSTRSEAGHMTRQNFA